MIIGYCLSGPDNGAHFFRGNTSEILCSECGSCLDFSWHPNELPNLTKTARDLDVSFTYDNRIIVNQRFKLFCRRQNYSELYFYKADNFLDLFYLVPGFSLPFDTERRGTRLIDMCGRCGSYKSIVGAFPAFIKDSPIIGDGIYRSDLEFGSGREKFPIVIIGCETHKKMKAANLTGIDFEEIVS